MPKPPSYVLLWGIRPTSKFNAPPMQRKRSRAAARNLDQTLDICDVLSKTWLMRFLQKVLCFLGIHTPVEIAGPQESLHYFKCKHCRAIEERSFESGW